MIYEILFLFFSFGMFFCVISLLTSKNPIFAVISLIGFFLNGSSILFYFRAEYLGVVYIVVYIGAIAVLFLFVVMMLDFRVGSVFYNYKTEYFFSSFLLLILFFIFFCNFFLQLFNISYNYSYYKSSYTYVYWVNYVEVFNDIVVFGYLLYYYNFIMFLLSGFILLLAMVGSIVLSLFYVEGMKVQQISDQVLRDSLISIFLYEKKT